MVHERQQDATQVKQQRPRDLHSGTNDHRVLTTTTAQCKYLKTLLRTITNTVARNSNCSLFQSVAAGSARLALAHEGHGVQPDGARSWIR